MSTLRSTPPTLEQAFPLARGGEKSDAPGFSFFFRDDRTFPEVLADWMLALDCAPQKDNRKFLDKTGLTGFITPEQWQDLLEGTLAPGRQLASHLSVLLPDVAALKENHLPSTFSFRRQAFSAYTRAQKEKTEILELSPQECCRLRKPLMEKLCATLHPDPANKRLKEASQPDTEFPYQELRDRLVAFVQERKLMPGACEEEILEHTASRYRRDPRTVLQFLKVVSPMTMPAKLKEWMEAEKQSAAEDYHGVGKLLSFFRQCAGFSVKGLATTLGVNASTLVHWNNGSFGIDCAKLPVLKATLGLNDEEYGHLLKLRLPALDEEWLAAQPEKKRAGLLLAAYRHRAGLLHKDLVKPLGMLEAGISKLETGENNIIRTKAHGPCTLPLIKTALQLNEEDYQRLLYECLPALNKDWLDKHPQQDKHAGLLLSAYRELASQPQKGFGGLGQDTVSVLENGKKCISDPHRTKLIAALKCTGLAEFDEKYFTEVCERSNAAIKERDAIAKVEKTAVGVIEPKLQFDRRHVIHEEELDQRPPTRHRNKDSTLPART